MTTGRYGFGRAVERGKVTQEQADAALARLELSSSFEAATAADVVIEAVPERLDLKIRVFHDLDRVAPPPTTILTSNTSGFSIATIAATTDRPDRVIGWHWASPTPVMRFAEIVRTAAPWTSEETIADRPRARVRLRQEPGRRQRRRHQVGIRRQPDLLRRDRRGQASCGRRGRDPRRRRPAHDGLLRLADGAVHHDPGRNRGLDLSHTAAGTSEHSRCPVRTIEMQERVVCVKS